MIFYMALFLFYITHHDRRFARLSTKKTNDRKEIKSGAIITNKVQQTKYNKQKQQNKNNKTKTTSRGLITHGQLFIYKKRSE
ncbi:MAG: hypothetical protein PUE95_06680 [Lachnospiraceae bacterium]|nr:hypothetical protein [Lachnospiraceae bacterium]